MPARSLGRRDLGRWIRAHADDPAVGPALLGDLGVTSNRCSTPSTSSRRSPAQTCATARPPVRRRLPRRAFRRLALDADRSAAEARGVKVTEDIRLTRYLVYEQPGALEETDTFTHALYAAPDEPGDGSHSLRYTRQQVVAGVFEPGGEAHGLAKPSCGSPSAASTAP